MSSYYDLDDRVTHAVAADTNDVALDDIERRGGGRDRDRYEERKDRGNRGRDGLRGSGYEGRTGRGGRDYDRGGGERHDRDYEADRSRVGDRGRNDVRGARDQLGDSRYTDRDERYDSYERDREERRGRSRSRSRDEDKNSGKGEDEQPPLTEEEMMQRMLGFGGFETTKELHLLFNRTKKCWVQMLVQLTLRGKNISPIYEPTGRLQPKSFSDSIANKIKEINI
ncbi:hypothetical protein BCR33DRAFT_712721 [Rhizoclosmatium globosum]|uniref:Uncharacterized protein n=1 Tax=Rhizoclosmatium globosum TaxID=329046 RepID=A0A1Y2CUK7_9FUNG|nr:hypothetical protein BCR33DRAFT_712721 [Rhizoclosmatium globosum]|eukprot:ORY50721.1 hypothetical protein BCR33DRAFT_712721 [Rhizoclosmatium globosum]